MENNSISETEGNLNKLSSGDKYLRRRTKFLGLKKAKNSRFALKQTREIEIIGSMENLDRLDERSLN